MTQVLSGGLVPEGGARGLQLFQYLTLNSPSTPKLSNVKKVVEVLKQCLNFFKDWMKMNQLKHTPDKSERNTAYKTVDNGNKINFSVGKPQFGSIPELFSKPKHTGDVIVINIFEQIWLVCQMHPFLLTLGFATVTHALWISHSIGRIAMCISLKSIPKSAAG